MPSSRQASAKLSARAVYAKNAALEKKAMQVKKGRGRPRRESLDGKNIKIQKKSNLTMKKRKRVQVKRKFKKTVNSSSEADCSSEGEDESEENDEVESEENDADTVSDDALHIEEAEDENDCEEAHADEDNKDNLENNEHGGDKNKKNVKKLLAGSHTDNTFGKNANEASDEELAHHEEDREVCVRTYSFSAHKGGFPMNKSRESVSGKSKNSVTEKVSPKKRRKSATNGHASVQSHKKQRLESNRNSSHSLNASLMDPRRPFFSSVPELPLKSISSLVKYNKSVPCGNYTAQEVFSWLINPITPQYFFKNIFEKNAIHIERQDANYYKDLFNCDEITNMLNKNSLLYGIHVDVVKYMKGERISLEADGRAYSSNVWEDYKQGYSIRLRNPQAYNERLWNMCSLLQEFFSCSVGVNMYLTPPKAQGFPPHYDDIDAFVVQVEGSKYWKVYRPRKCAEELARYPSNDFNSSEIGTSSLEVCLKPGEMIYIPRGYVHQAATNGIEHSLHLTFSTNQLNTWGDLLLVASQNALEKAILSNIEFRKAIPRDFFDYVGVSVRDFNNTTERHELINKVKELAYMSLAYLDPDAAADNHFARTLVKSSCPRLKLIEKQHSLHGCGSFWKNGQIKMKQMISGETEIQLIKKRNVRLVIDESGPKLYHNFENPKDPAGENAEGVFIDFDIVGVPAFNFLLKNFPEFVKVDDLPMENLEEKLGFALSLYEHGVLMTKTPLTPAAEEDFH